MSDEIPAVPAWYHVSWGADMQACDGSGPLGRVIAHVCVRFPQLPPPVESESTAKLTGRVSMPGLGQRLPLLDGTLRTRPGGPLGLDVDLRFDDDAGQAWRLTLHPENDQPVAEPGGAEPAVLTLYRQDSVTAYATGTTLLFLRLFLARMQAT